MGAMKTLCIVLQEHLEQLYYNPERERILIRYEHLFSAKDMVKITPKMISDVLGDIANQQEMTGGDHD